MDIYEYYQLYCDCLQLENENFFKRPKYFYINIPVRDREEILAIDRNNKKILRRARKSLKINKNFKNP